MASIVSFDEFDIVRQNRDLGKVVLTSGGYAPLHPGHISCIQEAKKLGDTLVVVVNGDNFLTTKHGKPFQDLQTRCVIVAALRDVDYVIPFEIENDMTVCEALKRIQPSVFAKGGDRTNYENIPEWGLCQKRNIKIETKVGYDKRWSSSWFLRDWMSWKFQQLTEGMTAMWKEFGEELERWDEVKKDEDE